MTTVPEQDYLLTPAEAADMLGLDSSADVAALATAGLIATGPGGGPGAHRRYDAASVAAYAASRQPAADTTPIRRPTRRPDLVITDGIHTALTALISGQVRL